MSKPVYFGDLGIESMLSGRHVRSCVQSSRNFYFRGSRVSGLFGYFFLISVVIPSVSLKTILQK